MVAALSIGVWAVYYAAARLGSQFYADDFIFLAASRTDRITPAWFFTDNFGHFAPITRAEYLLVQRIVGLDYAVAALLPAFYVAIAVAALAWIAGELADRRPVLLLLPFLTATSVLSMRTSLWFASGIHVLGAVAAYMVCIAGFVSYLKAGSRPAIVISVAALTAGLLVQERPFLVIGYLILIRYLFCLGAGIPAKRRSARDLGKQTWADRYLWTPYLLILTAYAIYRFWLFSSSPAPGSTSDGLTLIASGLQRTFLPALAGATTGPYSGWFPPAAFAGAGVVALTALWLALAYRQTWRVWAFVAVTYLANMAILAAGRLGQTDAISQSRDLQYFVDGLLCIPLGVLLGVGTLPERPSRPIGWPRKLLAAITALALVGVVVSTGRTWSQVIRGNNQTSAHFTLNRAIGQFSQLEQEVDLLRIRMSLDVVPLFLAPWVDQVSVFSLNNDVAAKLDVGAANKVVLSPIGEVMRVGQHTIVEFSPSDATVVAGGDAVVTSSVGGGVCVSGGAGSYVRVGLPTEIGGTASFFGVAYSSESDAVARAVAVSASGDAVYNGVPTDLPASPYGTRFDRLDGTEAAYVDLLFEDGVSDLCLSGFWIGEPTTSTSLGLCTVIAHDGSTSQVRPDCSATWPWLEGAA